MVKSWRTVALVLSVLACVGCGANAPRGTDAAGTNTTETGNGEAAAVPYTDASHRYRIDAPGRMAPTSDASAAVVGPSERLEVTILTGSDAGDPGATARRDAASLGTSLSSFKLVSGPAAITLNGAPVQKLVYTWSDGSSPVTGKAVGLTSVRYYFRKDATTLAVVTYGIVSNRYDPQGADDIALTFKWL